MGLFQKLIEKTNEIKQDFEQDNREDKNYKFNETFIIYFPEIYKIKDKELIDHLQENYEDPIEIHESNIDMKVYVSYEDNGQIGRFANVNFDNIIEIEFEDSICDDYFPYGIGINLLNFDEWENLMKEESYNHMGNFEYSYHSGGASVTFTPCLVAYVHKNHNSKILDLLRNKSKSNNKIYYH